jgi:alpha-galactosidase
VRPLKSIFWLMFGIVLPVNVIADGLALTPPMGWNSWNAFNMGINETVIRKTADLMVSSGLRDAGYIYLNLDDGWQASRDAQGAIQPDPAQFLSGMKALGEYLHSQGLKFGIYTCAGTQTCGKRPGSKGHEKQDMATYASWGVDYVKVDWCNTEGLDSKTQYALFRDGIRESGRPMVLSLCNWGVDKPWLWGRQMGQLWRTASDLVPCWDCKKDWGGEGIVPTLDKQIGLEPYSRPGGWNDPDMLQVGNSGLTLEESRAHFSLWCVLAAPLIAGNNLAAMKSEVKEILLNKEAIAVDQDLGGKQGARIKKEGKGREVWAKSLEYGAWAVCLFNRGLKSANVGVLWKDLGLKEGKMKIRDLWAHRDLGIFDGGYTVSVPSHGVVLLKVTEDKPMILAPADIWRIRAGAGDFKDHSGLIWSEDKAFEGGDVVGTGLSIAAQKDPELYENERWGPDFSYVFPVPLGKYQVRLKFAETYLTLPGQRVFDVVINGRKVLDHFDILKEAKGFAKGIDESFEDIQPDGGGHIRVQFVSEVQNAKVCAIEVIRQK